MSVEFEDYSIKVKQAMDEAIEQALIASAQIVQGAAQDVSRVDTGQLKRSWDYTIDGYAKSAKIGSPLQNAIWEEYGTGEYAVNGDGRKGGWYYEDDKGNGHFTHGKRPNRTLQKAFSASKARVVSVIEQIMKGRMN